MEREKHQLAALHVPNGDGTQDLGAGVSLGAEPRQPGPVETSHTPLAMTCVPVGLSRRMWGVWTFVWFGKSL